MLSRLWTHRFSGKLVALMLAILCLLNTNVAVLRSLRNTLLVTDLGGSAGYIPWFELCGTVPGAILMTWGLRSLLNRVSLQQAFLTTLAIFLSFFLVFVLGIYPVLPSLQAGIQSALWLPGHGWLASMLPIFFSMLFYVMSELWKIALPLVLFWGLINQYATPDDAKKLYAPLMLAGSLGTMLAGPMIQLGSSPLVWKWFHLSGSSWTQTLTLLVLLLSLVGVGVAALFQLLSRELVRYESLPGNQKEPSAPLSLQQCLATCIRSPYLLLLAIVVLGNYVAYSLGEVVFLDVLKHRFPEPRDYCQWMGLISFWSGLLTAVGALVVGPWVLRRYRWVTVAMITPCCLLFTGGAFFLALHYIEPAQGWRTWAEVSGLGSVVFCGSLMYCLCRAAKDALFDPSKELAFVSLPSEQKMQGKLIIDGICSRLGRGSASIITLTLVQICGSVMASSWPAGILAVSTSAACMFATGRLGGLLQAPARDKTN